MQQHAHLVDQVFCEVQQDDDDNVSKIGATQEQMNLASVIVIFKFLIICVGTDQTHRTKNVIFHEVTKDVDVSKSDQNLVEEQSVWRIWDHNQRWIGDHLHFSHGTPEFTHC